MPNVLLTSSVITRESLRTLENSLVFTKFVRRDFDSKFGVEGAKIGTTINARKPIRAVSTRGQAIQLQDAVETQVPLTLDTQYQQAMEFSSMDLSLSIDDFNTRIIEPRVSQLANDIDFDGALQYQNVPRAVGTPTVVPATLLVYLQAGAALDNEACPRAPVRANVISPNMQATIVSVLSVLFNPAKEIADQYKEGTMGLAAGFKWSMDQNIRTHTVGPLGGTPLVDGANQTGSSLLTKGWTAAVANRLNKGDVFTIANVNAVNPKNRQSTGEARQFVVTADTASTVGGAATIPIYPAIAQSGQFQTVNALPADSAALTILGTAGQVTPQGLAFHRDAFVFGAADLVMPRNVDMGSRVTDKQLGMSLRLIRNYDINTDRFPCRLDLLGGWATFYPELACRICS